MENIKKFADQVLEQISEPFFIMNGEQRCVFANKSFLQLLGLDSFVSGTTKAKDFWPKMPSLPLRNETLATEFSLGSGEVYRTRLAIWNLPQQYCLVRVLAGGVALSSQQNFQSQRLEALGVMAAGIAHDFNNVLAGILGHVTYLKTVLPPKGPHSESMKSIEEGARKSSLLTQQILSFSKADSIEKVARIDLGDLVNRTSKLLKGAVSQRYKLDFVLPEKPIHILADESRIAQILVNLVVNARDALQEKGSIHIELGIVRDKETLNQIFQGADLSAPTFALLQVIDDGQGMSQDVLDRVFEPYFSTKSDKGTGLGLYMVESIVKFYGGAIDIQSSLGKGTTVSVFLPALEQLVTEKVAVSSLKPVVGGSESILIVDDESPVRNVLSLSLRHLGYKVSVASTGQEALDKYREAPSGIDLVILDMLMPNLSGSEVFECLKEINPQVRVLIMSGYASIDLINSVLKNGGLGFMQKPFAIEDLARKVRECVAKA